MMIIYIAIFGWWFACLSSLPQTLMIWIMEFEFSKITQWFIINTLRLISCEKCLSFWTALIYFAYETRHLGYTILFACCTSCLAIIISRTYYKLLS